MEGFAHPLTLRFQDHALEQAYQAHRLGGFFRALDTGYLAGQTLLAAGFFLLQPFLFPSIAFHLANVVYPVLCLANRLVIQALPWPVYAQHRHRIQLIFRAMMEINVVWGLPSWSPPVAVRSLGSFAIHLILTSGVGCLNWASLGWPLLLQHHLPYNLLTASAFSHFLGPHVCAVVRQTATGRDLAAGLWRGVRAAAGASGRLRALLLVSPGPLPAAPDLSSPSPSGSTSPTDPPPHLSTSGGGAAMTAGSSRTHSSLSSSTSSFPLSSPPSFLDSLSEEAACWGTVSLIHLLLGFVLPTALVWTLERASREHFLARGYPLPPDSSSSGGGGNSGGGDSTDGRAGGGGGGVCGDVVAEVDPGVGGSAAAAAGAQTFLRRRRQRRRWRWQVQDGSMERENVSESESSPLTGQRQHTGHANLPFPGSEAHAYSNNSTCPAAPEPPPPPQQQQPSPQTLERLRRYRRIRGHAGGWDVCELIQSGLWLLLASLLVTLFWELQLVARFLLGPMLLQQQDRVEGGGGGGGGGG
ncbi:hypothetical protein PLESTM_001325900 [Pleodorina starrii]|nr:hypothetical protein PLESTM_001325900 [Pleodorina starrii]